MKTQRAANLHLSILSFFLLAFAAPPSFASFILYTVVNDAKQEITPFLTCTTSAVGDPVYEAACDYKNKPPDQVPGDGVIAKNETNPNKASITYIAKTLEPSLLIGQEVNLAARYFTDGTSATINKNGDPNLFGVDGNNLRGSWKIGDYDVQRWLTLSWDGAYRVYDVTDFAFGYYAATDRGVTLRNIALFGFVPVPAVPVPPAVWLFGSAIAGLAVLRRRRLSVAQA